MRFIAIPAALVLSACATVPAGAPIESAVAAVTPAPPSEAARLLNAAGGTDAPTQSVIERVLGRPDVTRQDGAGAALTYRFEQCALLLLFAADARNELRLAEAHPSPRRAGAAAPSVEQCAAEADARR